MASTLYATDDAKGTLPQGGYHRQAGSIEDDQDDAIGIDIDEFFKMAQYITDIPSLPADESVYTMASADLAEFAMKCADSKAGVVFVCPEMERSNIELMDYAFREKRLYRTVIYAPILTYVRLGYNYLAGFETEKWDWDSMPERGNENMTKSWTSPKTMSDSGNSVLVTDRSRTDGGTGMSVLHGKAGYENVELDADFNLANVSGDTVVGTLDGAIESKRVSSLGLNPVYYWTDKGGFFNGYYSPF